MSSADAEDITHHVFEEMLKAASRDELPDAGSLRPWLFVVARNRVLDFQRVHSRVHLSAPDELRRRLTNMCDASDPVWTFDDPVLAAGIRRLPRLQREVLLLRYVEDFDLSEIAATIGSTKSSVQNAHSLALRSLRQSLDWT